MDVVLSALLVFLAAGGLVVGSVLGFVATRRVSGLKRELEALRRRLERLEASAATPAEAASPWPAAAPAAPQPVSPQPVPPEPVPPEPVPPEPVGAAPAAPPPPARDLEALLTQRWGLWIGAAALLLAGVFLIRYAVDNALFGPGPRCVAATGLGAALLAAAEWLRRRPPSEPAPSALAAGGAAVLFGAAYGAGPFYALVPPLAASALMAAAAMVGLLAALRFGPLAAAVGVAGAFATPALVSVANPSLPGLFAYLLVVTAAALAVMRLTAWTWLGWAATVAGALWVALSAGDAAAADAWAPALFVPAAALLHLALLPAPALEHPVGRQLSWVPFAVLGASGLLLEAVAGGAAARVGVLALSPLAVWKGWSEPRLDRLPWLAAAFFLFALLFWALPEWQSTGEAIRVEGMVWAVLPGAWAPAVIRPLLLTAAGMAAFHAAAGLWLETRAPRPLSWAALAAGVPVLALLVTYAQVAQFQRDALWALAAALLAAGLTAAAWRARRADDRARAGVHAAGAAAALALGCAMVLHEEWLTLAIALFLPVLAWIEAAADLPPLRQVALAAAGLVLVRLFLNVWVLGYGFGVLPVVNLLVVTYGGPAVCFAWAAVLFRRRADDRLVGVLEGGAIAFVAALVALEIRHALGGGGLFGAFSQREAALQVGALAVEAGLFARFGRRPVPLAAARLLGLAALAGAWGMLVWIAFIPTPDWTVLVAGYAIPGLLAAWAAPRQDGVRPRRILDATAVVEGFAVLGLAIRFACHAGATDLSSAAIGQGKLWAYSGAWLLYGLALMAAGIAIGRRPLRIAALAIIGLVTLKVFLADMGELAGLWRVLSFLGLGLVLIALGAAYRRFVIAAPKQAPSD